MSLATSAPQSRSLLNEELSSKWLQIDLGEDHQLLSWTIVGGGWRVARQVVWRQVKNSDLSRDVEPRDFFIRKLRGEGFNAAQVVGFLTSASLLNHVDITAGDKSNWVRCVTTLGLGNALTIGDPIGLPIRVGTINILVQTSSALAFSASLEAMSLVTEARTAAMLELQVPSTMSARFATGTGTDCIALASPMRDLKEVYAGKHTRIGSLIGQAVYASILQAGQGWRKNHGG